MTTFREGGFLRIIKISYKLWVLYFFILFLLLLNLQLVESVLIVSIIFYFLLLNKYLIIQSIS